jgi:tetratricopeptide (TPR) repeat protein
MEHFQRSLEIEPRLAEAWYNKGEALRRKDLYIEAIEDFDRTIEIVPRHIRAWIGKGLALKALARDEEADLAFANALEQKGDEVD